MRSAQDAKRCVQDAKRCDKSEPPQASEQVSKPLRIADLGEEVPCDAAECESRAGRTRTCNQQIMSLLL